MQNSELRIKKKYIYTVVALFILTIILAIFSLLIGQYEVNILHTIELLFETGSSNSEAAQLQKIILGIRIPRTLAAIIIGGTLAISGLTYQAIFRNRLASQDVLGVSTGACAGAALAIVCGMTAAATQVMAFVSGIITIVLVFLLSKLVKTDKTLSLILAGVLVGGVMSSLLGLIKYLANPEKHLQAIVFWTMGDLSSISLTQLTSVILPIFVASVIIYVNRWNLNYFSFSDSEARSIGVRINFLRVILIIAATLIVAADVSIAGSIGWIGLAIPQLARLMVGENNRYTVLTSLLMGSTFLLLVDIINRLISTAELPVSIISGILGVPIFIICLYARNKNEPIS